MSTSAIPAIDDKIQEIYEALKLLELSGNAIGSKDFLNGLNFSEIWEELLHHAMVRNNCVITKRVIIQLINSGNLGHDEIILRVSQIDHQVSLDFVKRLRSYLHSNEFEAEWAKYSKVRRTAEHQLKSRLGKPLLNPNKFIKSS